MNQKKSNRFMPLIMAVCVVVGILIGTFYANLFSGNRLSIINSSSNKINNLLHIIDDQYVDTVSINGLVEKAMPQILAELDPHSVYISAKDVQAANDELKGSFSGVGIEFTIRKDTIHVENVIKNGPAERAGVAAGDKIVSVDGKPFVGKEVTQTEAMRRLKGPKDTKVKIGVVRYGEKGVRYFTITRGDIPQHSISATYMLDESTGYIKVKNFGENTYPELLIALAKLSQERFTNLVIDLRGNTGGYLASAVQMVNEFLPKDRLIVYTEGRKSPRQEYRSDGRGAYQAMPLVVLIDEGSASASEIFAGAIQDNDRGTVIGRRSFGKGLVQQPIAFNDGSMVRLTIARYYSPSGRCIQKPYTAGDDRSYEEDLLSRYQHGEFFSQDSIKHNGPAYHTSIGRTVYGGGGITPDIFVPEDTSDVTSYYKEASLSGLIIQFAYNYTDNHRAKLKEFGDMESLSDYLVKQNTVEEFARYAATTGLRPRTLRLRKSHKLLERYINSRIIYNILDEQDWLEYLNQDDPAIDATLKVDVEGDPQRIGEILKHPLPFADHSIFSDCALAAEMRWSEGRLRMTSIQGNADDLTFSGRLSITPAPFVISGELSLGDLDLDDYKSENHGSTPKKLESRDFTRWPRVNLQLSAEHVRWNRVHLENVHARLAGQNGSYEFNPLSGILAGSPVTASMKTVMLPSTPLSSRLSINFSVPQANLEDIALSLAEKPLLKGNGAINASLTFTTSRGLPSLSGKGIITSSQVETAFSILPADIPLASSILSTNRFDRFFLSFVSKDGIFSVDRLTLDAARLSLSGSGTVDLVQKTVKAEGSVQVAGTSALPVRLEGDLRDPKYSLEGGSEQNRTLSPRAIELDLSFSRQVRDILGR